MSETRAEFYRRMEHIAETRSLIGEREGEIRFNMIMGMRDAAAQGYAAALRDVIAELDDYVLLANPASDGTIRTAIDVIEEFAAEKDIDLEDDDE